MRAATWTDENTYEFSAGSMRFENWESNVAGRVGLAAAVEYAIEIGLPDIEKRIFHLARYLRMKLQEIDGVTVSDLGKRQCGIVTFATANERPSQMVQRLRTEQVNMSFTDQASARLDLGRRNIAELARASVHYFNTESEIDRVCSLVIR